eukprot:scaffold166796_cov39-Prasinocladus_malaysianus.AAC.1
MAAKVATALSSLAKSAGPAVLTAGDKDSEEIAPVHSAAVLALIGREAAGIERDPVALENALRAALRGDKIAGGLDGKASTALQGFLLGQLRGCLGRDGPEVGLLAVRCLRGGVNPKQMVAAAIECLGTMP